MVWGTLNALYRVSRSVLGPVGCLVSCAVCSVQCAVFNVQCAVCTRPKVTVGTLAHPFPGQLAIGSSDG